MTKILTMRNLTFCMAAIYFVMNASAEEKNGEPESINYTKIVENLNSFKNGNDFKTALLCFGSGEQVSVMNKIC
jgi:hypothetical protein